MGPIRLNFKLNRFYKSKLYFSLIQIGPKLSRLRFSLINYSFEAFDTLSTLWIYHPNFIHFIGTYSISSNPLECWLYLNIWTSSSWCFNMISMTFNLLKWYPILLLQHDIQSFYHDIWISSSKSIFQHIDQSSCSTFSSIIIFWHNV